MYVSHLHNFLDTNFTYNKITLDGAATHMIKPKENVFLNRISQEVLAFAYKVWGNDSSIANRIVLEALETINKTYVTKPVFYAGKSDKRIVGSLFYILGLKYKCAKTQSEIARKIRTTEVTIRKGYRSWLKHFLSLSEH